LLHALGMDGEEILNTFYDRVTLQARQGRLGDPLSSPSAGAARSRPSTLDRRRDRRGRLPGRQKITARAANKAAKDGLKTLL
jgi:DNA-directed RNA polymerase subunit beta